MAKYIIGAIALILAAAGGYYFIYGSKLPNAAQQPAVQQPQATATTTYATSSYTVVYPVDFTIDPNFQNTEVSAQKPIAGVKLAIPMAMATGTNLGSDTFISIEQLPRAKNCTGDIYLLDEVTPSSVTDGGVAYSLATTSGAGAGNFYEEMVYAIAGSKPCTAVRYWIHSMQIGNFEPGAVRAYDREKLLEAFDAIRRSVSLAQ